MKTRKMRWIGIFLAFILAVTFMPQGAFAADGDGAGASDGAGAEAAMDPYMRVPFAALSKEDRLSLTDDMAGCKVQAVSGGEGVLLKGPAGELDGGRVTIADDFDFSKGSVARISLRAGTEMRISGKALIYLDDAAQPVCEFLLENGKSANKWTTITEQTLDVYDKTITGRHKVSVGFELSGVSEDKTTNIFLDYVEFVEDPAIPTLYFNIDENADGYGTVEEMNSSEDHSVRCTGSLDIRVPGTFEKEYQEDTTETTEGIPLEYIRGRGNSTWSNEKKPYKFTFQNKQDLFGMGPNKHYVLLANWYDRSLLRNRITYWIGQELGMPFTPQCIPVDVVMNGEYYGSYLLAEQIRIGESRVNIDELKKTSENITGGYLLRMSPYDYEDEAAVFETKRGERFMSEDPDFTKGGRDAQKEYISGYVQKVEDAIFGKDFKDEDGVSYTEYMDVDSAVDYWWIQEFTINGDAYVTDSTYLYKPKDGKLYWGPLWDFDYVAWGDLEPPEEYNVEGLGKGSLSWFVKLYSDDTFTQKLKARWSDLDSLLTEIVKDGGKLDEFAAQTAVSQRYDFEKYGMLESAYGEDDVPENHTYPKEIEQLRGWIKARQDWVADNLSKFDNMTYRVTCYVDGEVYDEVDVIDSISPGEILEPPEKAGYVFDGWYTKAEGGEKLQECTDIDSDTDLYARYVKEEEASLATDLFVKESEAWADINGYYYSPAYSVMPEDALGRKVTWVSSDEDIAAPVDEGMIELKKTGDVTLTGRLKSGAQATVLLHVIDGSKVQRYPVDRIEMENDEITIGVGEYAFNPYKLIAENEPIDEYYVEISTEDDDIVSINDSGVVTGLKPGTAMITVKETFSDAEASYLVTVTGEEEEEKATIDEIDSAITTLLQLKAQVKKADYTSKSYAAFASAYKAAMAKLRSGEDLTQSELRQLRHEVIIAKLDLVSKSANTMKVKAKTVKVKRAKLKKKAQVIKRSKALTVKNPKGTVTYKLAGVTKAKYKKYFKVAKKTGKITVKKKLRKGLYRVKIKVTAAGNGTYKPVTKTVTVKVRVR